MELGCNSMCGTAVTGKYMPSEGNRNKNELYRWIFEANYKSGLWELDIFTTKPLTVPEHRRPPQSQKSRKIKEKNRKQAKPNVECVENTNTRRNILDDDEDFFEDFEPV